MGINISQFAPPGTVSKLVWDDDMKPGVGKVFKGNLTGNVTGDLTGDVIGNITNGGVNGYLLRSGVVSASSGTLVVPAGQSIGNNPITINLNGNGTYCIVGNTQKCFYPNPCNIPIVFGPNIYGAGTAYAESYTSDGVLIQRITATGNLNIYNAGYIVLCGEAYWDSNAENTVYQTVSVADAYIDADTTITPGMVPPPTSGVFTGDVVGNVTGNVTGDVTGNVTGKTSYNWTMTPLSAGTDLVIGSRSEREFYDISPNGTITGTIRIRKTEGTILGVYLIGINEKWDRTFIQELTTDLTTYTIAPNTSALYLKNLNTISVNVAFNKFTLT